MKDSCKWGVGMVIATSGLMITLAAIAQSEDKRNLKEERLLALEDEIGVAFETIVGSAESRLDLENKIQRFLADNEALLQEQARSRGEVFKRKKMVREPAKIVEPRFDSDAAKDLYESEKQMAAAVDDIMVKAKDREEFEERFAKFLDESQKLRDEQSKRRGEIFVAKRGQNVRKPDLPSDSHTHKERDLYENEKQMAATVDEMMAKAKDRGEFEEEIARFLERTKELREEQSKRRGEIFVTKLSASRVQEVKQTKPKLKNDDQ